MMESKFVTITYVGKVDIAKPKECQNVKTKDIHKPTGNHYFEILDLPKPME